MCASMGACVRVCVCVCVCRVLELAQLSLVVRLHGLRPVRGQRSKGDFRAGMNHQQQAPSLAHVVPRRGRIVSPAGATACCPGQFRRRCLQAVLLRGQRPPPAPQARCELS